MVVQQRGHDFAFPCVITPKRSLVITAMPVATEALACPGIKFHVLCNSKSRKSRTIHTRAAAGFNRQPLLPHA